MTPLLTAIQRSAVASSQLRSRGVSDLGVSDLGVSGMFEWNAYSIRILFFHGPRALYNRDGP